MALVTHLLSTDGDISLRVCSEGCCTGVLGGCVVVKDIVLIPSYIIHLLTLKIRSLKFDSN